MNFSKRLTVLAVVTAVALSPAVAFGQSQAEKTGVGAAAGQEAAAVGAFGGLSAGVVAGVAVAAAVAVAVAVAFSDEDEVATTTASGSVTPD
ncbi:MAG: hypothetical protein FJX56_01295 [Alphaproteobacteria bacterium]|nr:hypothetical protein [Alphaproteobacteria bacterium]